MSLTSIVPPNGPKSGTETARGFCQASGIKSFDVTRFNNVARIPTAVGVFVFHNSARRGEKSRHSEVRGVTKAKERCTSPCSGPRPHVHGLLGVGCAITYKNSGFTLPSWRGPNTLAIWGWFYGCESLSSSVCLCSSYVSYSIFRHIRFSPDPPPFHPTPSLSPSWLTGRKKIKLLPFFLVSSLLSPPPIALIPPLLFSSITMFLICTTFLRARFLFALI